jgi:hypothetical protein
MGSPLRAAGQTGYPTVSQILRRMGSRVGIPPTFLKPGRKTMSAKMTTKQKRDRRWKAKRRRIRRQKYGM